MMCLWRVSRHRSFLVWELSILKHLKKKKRKIFCRMLLSLVGELVDLNVSLNESAAPNPPLKSQPAILLTLYSRRELPLCSSYVGIPSPTPRIRLAPARAISFVFFSIRFLTLIFYLLIFFFSSYLSTFLRITGRCDRYLPSSVWACSLPGD